MTLDNGSVQGMIRVFDMPSGNEIATMDFGGTVNELFFSQDDQYLLATGHGRSRVYRTADWSLAQTLKGDQYSKFITGVFSPNAKHVLAGNGNGDLYLWEWQENKLLKSFNHTGKKVETVTWHPSGDYVAFAGRSPYIWIYRVEDILSNEAQRIPLAHKAWAGDNAEYMDFNGDGSFLVSAHQNGLIKLWAWMGEDPSINARRHQEVKEEQKAYNEKKNP